MEENVGVVLRMNGNFFLLKNKISQKNMTRTETIFVKELLKIMEKRIL
jgi:hypothetical protein